MIFERLILRSRYNEHKYVNLENFTLYIRKDGKSKLFMDANDRFADAFNYHMYGGEQVIKPKDLEERDVTELLTVYGINLKGNIQGKTQQKWRDLLKHAIIKKHRGRLLAFLMMRKRWEES